MRLSGSELVTISLLFLLISVAAAQYQYYDDEDQVGHGIAEALTNLLPLATSGQQGKTCGKYI